MLEHTFIHIPGIGLKTEQNLWRRGISTWSDFLAHQGIIFNHARDEEIRTLLNNSLDHRRDISFFCDRLTSAHMWRLYGAFKDRAVYLDIETSGGYQGMDEITVIGIYDGRGVRTFINGVNLTDFEAAIACYDLLVTFNGGSFDLPFIRRWFPNITLPPAHIDLRFPLKRLGHGGGLKRIEKAFGLLRDEHIDGFNGYDAVNLWRAYQWGDHGALDLLIRYNTADIVNLRPLMEASYEGLKERLLPESDYRNEKKTRSPLGELRVFRFEE